MARLGPNQDLLLRLIPNYYQHVLYNLMTSNPGWKRLGIVGLGAWVLFVCAAIINDQKDACQYRENNYFAQKLRAEYDAQGADTPHLYHQDGKSYVSQAIDKQYLHPLPAGRLQSIINDTHRERHDGPLCKGTYLEVALQILPLVTLLPLGLFAVLFAVYRTIRWVARGFRPQ
jgi:hypothetical protein